MKKKELYKQENEAFLKSLLDKEGIKTLPHNIMYEVIKTGDGAGEVGPRSVVTCYYRGSLISGKVFDDAWQRGYPEAFRVDDLVTGFQIALQSMHIGDLWKVYIPYQEGYGSRNDGEIPGFSTLIFEIELTGIS